MLKQEYAQHIAEMSQRVRCEEWAELEKNKEDFFETGNTWALSWLGHLTVLDAAMYHYTGKAEWLERVKECLGIFFSVQDELVQRYEDGSLPFIYKQEDGKPIEGPSKNPLEVLEENDTDPWHFQVVETIFSFTPVLRGLYIIGRDAFTQAEWNRLETLCYAEINHIFRDCEWGRHNRATLRAIALLLFARLFPQNASAARCLKLADMLFEDSLGNWSIEDAHKLSGPVGEQHRGVHSVPRCMEFPDRADPELLLPLLYGDASAVGRAAGIRRYKVRFGHFHVPEFGCDGADGKAAQ